MDNIERIIKLWNQQFTRDPTTKEVLEKKFFDSEYLKAISPTNSESAFSLTGVRTKQFYYDNDLENAWILWLGFTDRKAAESLLDSHISALRELGKKNLYYSNFTPDYFLPGVDRSTYPELYELLSDYGFKQRSDAIEMSLNLNDYDYEDHTENGDFIVDDFSVHSKSELLDFIKDNFASDWYYRASNVAEEGEKEQIAIARLNGKIIGYSMFSGAEGKYWYYPGERFGPFGVAEGCRGLGAGSSLLRHTLNMMKGRNIKTAYFLWTDEKAAKLYRRFGFQEKRRYSIMNLEL